MSVLSPRRYFMGLAACTLALIVLLVISPGIGSSASGFTWWDVWRAKCGIEISASELRGRPFADVDSDGAISPDEARQFATLAANIGFQHRLPRSLLALCVGVTLAMCGATFQVLFRNPLATPYTLGIASGGSLGALIAIRLGWEASFVGVSSLSLAALAGGMIVVGAVLFLARSARRLTSNEMLLAGVTMGMFCAAMMMLITAISSERQTFRVIRWMMGSLDTISTLKATTMLPLILPAWAVLIGSARALNQYRLGDEMAATRGVNLRALQGLCVLVCTLATAAVVANCGPIGFVGLVVPHVVVLLFGQDCRILLPASALIGGSFLILCDWASRQAMHAVGLVTGRELGSSILPIGVVTAVIGVPLFLTLLRSRRR
jgi:iron complex transport system permease protein